MVSRLGTLTHMLVFYQFVTGVAAFYGCLGLWAAVSPRRWFLRACAVLAMLALLVPIRAYEPLILFGLTTVILLAGVQTARFWRHRATAKVLSANNSAPASRYRSGISDLLLLFVLTGGISWLASLLLSEHVTISWWRATVVAGFLAVIVVASAALACTTYRWRCLVLVVLAVATASTADALVLSNWLTGPDMLDLTPPMTAPISFAIRVNAMFYGCFAMWSLLLTATVSAWGTTSTGHLRRTFLGATVVAAVPLVLFAAWVYLRMLDVPTIRPPVASKENALPRVIALAKALPAASLQENDAMIAELYVLVDQTGFVEWPAERPDFTTSMLARAELNKPRNLARELSARSAALLTAGQPDQAADQALAILKLGSMIGREGNAHHRHESEAVMHMAHCALARSRADLSREKLWETAQVVAKVAAEREPVDTTAERQELWDGKLLTWQYLLQRTLFRELFDQPLTQNPTVNALFDRVADGACFAQLAELDLLIRAHRLETGNWPATLDEVEPPLREPLKIDPFSQQPFVYRPTAEGFLLYSVGSDGADNGGKFTNMRTYCARDGFDLDVDTAIRP